MRKVLGSEWTFHEEEARKLIEQNLKRGSDVLPFENFWAFEEAVINRYKYPKSGKHIYDRTDWDTLAFVFFHEGLEPRKISFDELMELVQEHATEKMYAFFQTAFKDFDLVFHFDFTGNNLLTEWRRDGFEGKLHQWCRHIYEALGVPVVTVPTFTSDVDGSRKRRVEFILRKLKSF